MAYTLEQFEQIEKQIAFNREWLKTHPQPEIDPAFEDIDPEKEIPRLRRVLEGLYTRRDRMLYTYGAMDGHGDTERKLAARAKLEKTRSWRGLEFDIEWTERRLRMLTGE